MACGTFDRAGLDVDLLCLARRQVHPGATASGPDLALAANLQWGARALRAAVHLQAVGEPVASGRGRHSQVMALEVRTRLLPVRLTDPPECQVQWGPTKRSRRQPFTFWPRRRLLPEWRQISPAWSVAFMAVGGRFTGRQPRTGRGPGLTCRGPTCSPSSATGSRGCR